MASGVMAVPTIPRTDEREREAGVKYVRRNFLCGLQGREPKCFERFERAAARVDFECSEPAAAWNNARASGGALGCRAVQRLQSLACAAVSVRDGELRKARMQVMWTGRAQLSVSGKPGSMRASDVWVAELRGRGHPHGARADW